MVADSSSLNEAEAGGGSSKSARSPRLGVCVPEICPLHCFARRDGTLAFLCDSSGQLQPRRPYLAGAVRVIESGKAVAKRCWRLSKGAAWERFQWKQGH